MNESVAEIRQFFLDFFYSNGHKVLSSSSLVPDNDPTLLFTNAGMNQFKNIFLGVDEIIHPRVATSQRCVRIGGKHNDLENVGYSTCHHTFFEMLGNFSFNDYFKNEAIQYAWELLTSKKWFNLQKERLLVTVHESDKESYEIWEKKIGIPNKRIFCVKDKEGVPYSSGNFWQMGDTGPCGPCTEIFYERNNSVLDDFPTENFKNTGHRYVEIWNIVFIQFNRQIDGTMEPLSKLSVDTGMGLERIASILQGVNSNYEIDLFRMLIKKIAKTIGTTDLESRSLYVIADHIRSCAFLIADNVTPSNENRGYALRRIIRRAIRHGYSLGVKDTFFYKLVSPLIEVMGIAGEILKCQKIKIEEILKTEEERFSCTLRYGANLLDKKLKKLEYDTLSGRVAFLLHDTYGFPIDLTIDTCRERGVKVDISGFENEMKKQRNLARKFSNFNINCSEIVQFEKESEFLGYNFLELNSNVIAIFIAGKKVNCINTGQEGIIVLDKTPFYAESGGQVGDRGKLEGLNFVVKIIDTRKYGKTIGHLGKTMSGFLKVGDNVKASVDKSFRKRVCINHSATHLLHAALRMELGTHVFQKGCLINDKELRFDFSHWGAMNLKEIRTVENLINMKIRCNLPIETTIMDLEVAKAQGAIALFNNKYEKFVRVLKIDGFSTELCKGTHATRTGDIGLFRIISERSISANVRRIEAVSGESAISNLHMQSDQLYGIAHLLKSNTSDLTNKVQNILKRSCQLEKETMRLKNRIAILETENLSSKAIEINGVKLLVNELANIEPEILRIIINNLKNQFGSAIAILATITEGKIFLIAWVSKDIIDRVKAEELVALIAQKINGKGGGHSEIAQASGTNVKMLPKALSNIKYWISKKLYDK